MQPRSKPRLLCVDDEPNVLEALARQLRHRWDVVTATGGQSGLERLVRDGPFAVVMSDMRMPGMNGAAFLATARTVAKDTVRLLLTGHTDIAAAIAAVNEGHIFRFLTKPCSGETLHAALEAAAEQHRLITTERTLLERTLHGSVQALIDALAMANPAAFGRASRIRERAAAVNDAVRLCEPWQLEVAAMLAQVGLVSLPAETLARFVGGAALRPDEQEMIERLPGVATRLLGSIPRLEPVCEIVAYQAKRWDGGGTPGDAVHGDSIPAGARILKTVLDLDLLEAQGLPVRHAIDTLRGRAGAYDPLVLDALDESLASGADAAVVREVRLRELAVGMVLDEDVKAANGVLLIARGQVVTPTVVERFQNVSRGLGLPGRVRVVIRTDGPAATAPAPRDAVADAPVALSA